DVDLHGREQVFHDEEPSLAVLPYLLRSGRRAGRLAGAGRVAVMSSFLLARERLGSPAGGQGGPDAVLPDAMSSHTPPAPASPARPDAPPIPPPTHADVPYGRHERHVLDFWKAKPGHTGSPTPLIVFIHGGGFRQGDKRLLAPAQLERWRAAGISVASINYR